MYHLEVQEEYNFIHPQDLWVYNKLQLSRILGYTCGPAGMKVPKSDSYIIRPSINFMGMGRLSRIETLKNSTEHLHPAEFWCEIFKGDHISVDFYKKEAKLVVKGTRNTQDPLYKWKKWEKIDKNVNFPAILENLTENYDWINCEFIGDKLIEVHFRQNPDFRYGNSEAIPVWDEKFNKNCENYTFIEDKDYKRTGFLIK